MVYTQPRNRPREWDSEIQIDHLISVKRTELVRVKKKLRAFRIEDFALSVEHRVKLRECDERDKYLNPARGLKKLWKMKVTVMVMVIPTVIGKLRTITKVLVRGQEDMEIRGQVEMIQTTVLLRSARIQRKVLETLRDFLSLNYQWKTIS